MRTGIARFILPAMTGGIPYRLADLIDLNLFQKLQDELNEIYSFPSAIIDNDGNILTATAWQEVCTKFYRTNDRSLKECITSDQYIRDHIKEAAPAISYKCPHGLIDNATPILINGVHLGNFFTGQLFLDPPDMDFFRGQARQYGFDEEPFLAAVKKVPIWNREKLDKYLAFIKTFTEILAGIGLRNLQEIESHRVITETQRALQESEIKFRSVFENSVDGIGISCNGVNVFMNKAYAHLFGYDAGSELTGHSILEQIAPSSRSQILDYLHKHASGEPVPSRFEARGLKKTGEEFFFDVSVDSYSIDGKEHVISIVRDATSRKALEGELIAARRIAEMNEKKYRLMVQNSPDLTVMQDASGKVVFISAQCEEVLGHSAEKFMGIHFPDCIHPEDVHRVYASMLKALSGVEITNLEYRLYGSDGELRWISHTARPLYDGEVFQGVQSTIRNITDRKRGEEKLETSLREKEVLLRELYHRTKNNMNVISSYLHLQSMFTQDTKLTVILQDMISRIHAMSLVHQMLYRSKNLSRIRLNEYVRELVASIAEYHRSNGTMVTIDYDLDDTEVVIDVAVPCGLVLNELVTNAFKHAFKGRSAGVLQVGIGRQKDGQVIITLADDGIGIDPARNLKESESLGLLTVFDIVEKQLGGTIKYESEHGLAWSVVFKDQAYAERI